MLLLLLACDDPTEADNAAALTAASEQVTFGTVGALGPHRLEASVVRAVTAARDGGPAGETRTTRESLVLAWKDADHWSFSSSRDGRVRNRVVVYDAVAWSAQNDAPLERKGDAELFRVELAQSWDPWQLALDGVRDQIGLTPGAPEVVEGRRVVRHEVAPVPLAPGARRTWTVSSASGVVWIDEATAVRLLGEVRVSASARHETSETALTFALSSIGVDPGIAAPAAEK